MFGKIKSVARAVAGFLKAKVGAIAVAVCAVSVMATQAMAEGVAAYDPSTALATGIGSATTTFNLVAVLSVGALVYAMIMRFGRRGAK